MSRTRSSACSARARCQRADRGLNLPSFYCAPIAFKLALAVLGGFILAANDDGSSCSKGERFMFIMLTVASLCAVVLIAGLLALVCRHRPEMWIATDDAIMCFIAPVMIMFGTIGMLMMGWRLTHGGLAEVSAQAWLGSAVIVAIAVGVWILAARWIRAGRRDPLAAASAAGSQRGAGTSGSSR